MYLMPRKSAANMNVRARKSTSSRRRPRWAHQTAVAMVTLLRMSTTVLIVPQVVSRNRLP